jgi:hypothetical protein
MTRERAAHEIILCARAVVVAEQACLSGMRSLADFTELCRLSEDLLTADRNLDLARKQLARTKTEAKAP